MKDATDPIDTTGSFPKTPLSNPVHGGVDDPFSSISHRRALGRGSGVEFPINSPNDVVLTVVAAIEELTGKDQLELAPLYETIDPDALSVLLRSVRGRDTPVSVVFEYEGYAVTIDANEVTIQPVGSS